MKLMLTAAAAILTATLGASSVHAGEATVEKNLLSQKSPETLARIITDYENMCDSGCTYKVSNMEESLILEQADSQIVSWQYVNAFRSTKNYFVVNITTDEVTGEIVIKSGFPEESEIPKLEEKYGKKHEPVFNKLNALWKLTPQQDGSTKVYYALTADSGLLDIGIAKRIVVKELNKASDQVLSHLEQ